MTNVFILQNHDQSHIQYLFGLYVVYNTVQSNWIIFFQGRFQIWDFCKVPGVSLSVFIFIKTTSSHEGNLRTDRIRNSGEPH